MFVLGPKNEVDTTGQVLRRLRKLKGMVERQKRGVGTLWLLSNMFFR